MQTTSYLSAFAAVGLALTCLASCGGGGGGSNASHQQICNQTMAARCEKASACGGLADMGYTSVAECTQALQKENCAVQAELNCPSGKTYHADQAQKCVDDTKAQSCADFTNGDPPLACSQVCTAGGVMPSTGGTSGAGVVGTGGSGAGGTSAGTGGTSGGTGGTGGRTGTATGGTAGASTLPACTGTFKPCGGDPSGTWDIVSACLEGDLLASLNAAAGADYPDCAGGVSAASVTLTGSVTYGAGTYSYDAQSNVAETVTYTPKCYSSVSPGSTLSTSTCNGIQQALILDAGATASCTYATSCNCQLTVANVNTSSGTYQVSGSTITEDTGSSYDFCVNGNTMTQRELIEDNVYGISQMKKR
jgi:hypothetical protein